jgi:hypothetical protein
VLVDQVFLASVSVFYVLPCGRNDKSFIALQYRGDDRPKCIVSNHPAGSGAENRFHINKLVCSIDLLDDCFEFEQLDTAKPWSRWSSSDGASYTSMPSYMHCPSEPSGRQTRQFSHRHVIACTVCLGLACERRNGLGCWYALYFHFFSLHTHKNSCFRCFSFFTFASNFSSSPPSPCRFSDTGRRH